jgi:hypothetical protein
MLTATQAYLFERALDGEDSPGHTRWVNELPEDLLLDYLSQLDPAEFKELEILAISEQPFSPLVRMVRHLRKYDSSNGLPYFKSGQYDLLSALIYCRMVIRFVQL